jgi:hypothetical protein
VGTAAVFTLGVFRVSLCIFSLHVTTETEQGRRTIELSGLQARHYSQLSCRMPDTAVSNKTGNARVT